MRWTGGGTATANTARDGVWPGPQSGYQNRKLGSCLSPSALQRALAPHAAPMSAPMIYRQIVRFTYNLLSISNLIGIVSSIFIYFYDL